MLIGGLQKFSVLDYPEHLSAIIFTQGCNFRCQYCYNPMLVGPYVVGKVKYIASPDMDEVVEKGHPLIKEGDLFDFLKDRIGKLDAVVITGGEPTIHNDLDDFIIKIKNLGYKVKLDTNGTNPQVLSNLIEKKLLDYIAMDIKTSPDRYDLVTAVQPNLNALKESISMIISSNLPYEFRTTLVPGLVTKEDIKRMGELIKGADRWFLQQFKKNTELVNNNFQNTEKYSQKEIEELSKIAIKYVKKCETR